MKASAMAIPLDQSLSMYSMILQQWPVWPAFSNIQHYNLNMYMYVRFKIKIKFQFQEISFGRGSVDSLEYWRNGKEGVAWELWL